jgi:hypothetical protein
MSDIKKKQSSLDGQPSSTATATTHVSSVQIPISSESSEATGQAAAPPASNDGANKYENVSDNGSEISDEGYRSLGLIQSNNPKRISLHSQASNEDAETSGE